MTTEPARSQSEIGVQLAPLVLTLGQPLSRLSGGECQRLKRAAELGKTGQVYVLENTDEHG